MLEWWKMTIVNGRQTQQSVNIYCNTLLQGQLVPATKPPQIDQAGLQCFSLTCPSCGQESGRHNGINARSDGQPITDANLYALNGFPLQLLEVTYTAEGACVPKYPDMYNKVYTVKVPESLTDPEHFGHLPWLYCKFVSATRADQQDGPATSKRKVLCDLLDSLGIVRTKEAMAATSATKAAPLPPAVANKQAVATGRRILRARNLKRTGNN